MVYSKSMKTHNQIYQSPLAYRLTIGVTGHRKLQNTEALKLKVGEVVDEILEKITSSESLPVKLAVLSPLAEGADRLVAEVVLEKSKEAMLKVVLPLAVSDYLDDFETDESKADFHRLMAKARFPISLREKRLAEEFDEANLAEARRLAYGDVGRFVVDHSDVLIALWDGHPAHGKGGTAEIVEYAKKNGCPLYIVNTNNPDEIISPKHIHLPRDLVKKLEEFNKVIYASNDQAEYINNQYRELYENNEGKNIPEATKLLVKEKLIPYYTIASSEANKYQDIYYNAGIISFMLALAAVGVIAFGAIFLPGGAHNTPPWYIFLLEAAILAVIGSLITRADRMHAHKKWIEYRFLAERLRSDFYLVSCETEPMPLFAKRHADRKLDSYEWTLFAHEEILNGLFDMKGCVNEQCSAYADFIKNVWIDEQTKWHRKKARDRTDIHKNLEHWGSSIFYVAIFLALLHVLVPFLLHAMDAGEHSHIVGLAEKGLTWISLILPAVAATLEAIRAHRDYRRLAERSIQMAGELENLGQSFRLVGSKNFESLLRQTEKVMLDENKEWMTFVSAAELYKSV